MPDIRILKVDANNAANLSLKGQANPQCEGVISLLQAVVANLLTTPGTDRLIMNRGGGLGDLCRKYRALSPELKEALAERIQATEFFMIEEQRRLDLPEDERLVSLELRAVVPDADDPSAVNIEIGLKAASGAAVSLTL